MNPTTQANYSADTQIRIGIIGCGMLGLVHTQRLCALPNVEVVAVTDPDHAAMERVASASNSPDKVTFHKDYLTLLAEAELDAISINSPNRWHTEQLLAALEQRLHVLCEKPLSMVPTEVNTVIEATQKAQRVVAIAYQSRYRTQSRILRSALQSGKWGKITSISLFAGEDWLTPNRNTWRHDPSRCPGGFFADANGHQLDLLFWMTGLRPTWVSASNDGRGTPVPIVTWGEAKLVGETANAEVPMTFLFAGDVRRWREEMMIHTEGADFIMRDTKVLWSDGSADFAPFPESRCNPEDLIAPNLPDTGFITALRGGQPILTEPHTVFPVLNFTLAALESAESHSPVGIG